LPEEAWQTAMTMYDGLAPQSTASLQRDVMEGRPSELETQIGEPWYALGRKLMWQPHSTHLSITVYCPWSCEHEVNFSLVNDLKALFCCALFIFLATTVSRDYPKRVIGVRSY